tara:strand:- start:615 stop:728 length:114 start_codon:yes stop_codon:yes gene_type:complete
MIDALLMAQNIAIALFFMVSALGLGILIGLTVKYMLK